MFKLLALASAIIFSSTQGTITVKEPNKAIEFSKIKSVKPSFIPPTLSLEPISSSSSSSYSNPNDSSDYFSCPVYGPFKVGDPNFDASFTYRIFGPSRQIIERIRILSSTGSVVHASSKPSRDYIEDSLETISFTIPIRDYLTKDGITIKFEILDKRTRAIIREYGSTIYPVQDNNPTAQELKSAVYETKNIGFYGDGVTMKGITEKFDFTSIGDYLDIDYYYRINIKDIFFKYQSVFSFSCSSINLRFEDRENLFPYLIHNDYIVSVPLKTTSSGEKVSLNYKNYFYVNKRTLQLSNTSGTGFTLSSNFYLPINGKKVFNNKLLYLDFTGLGSSNITVSFPVRYVADRSLVGLCGDSGYYVEGGVK